MRQFEYSRIYLDKSEQVSKNALLEDYDRRNKEYKCSYFMYKVLLLREKLKDAIQITKVLKRATKQPIKQARMDTRKSHGRTLEIMVCVCGFYHIISPLMKCHHSFYLNPKDLVTNSIGSSGVIVVILPLYSLQGIHGATNILNI